jgi:tRNA(Ile)-lysidine synthase
MSEPVAGSPLDAVRASEMLVPGRPAVVLFSGGRDSTCLLDVAVELLGPDQITALHVNYGLREAAAGDERHCRAVCDELGVTLEALRPAPPPPSGNIQAWARELRYGAGRRLAAEQAAVLASAHTADDQVETILYRLAASPGRRALLGMRARDGVLVRPLLSVRRAETGAWCTARGLAWRDDESNADERFARARVRHGLLPALEEIHPAAAENVLRTSQLLREEAQLIEVLVQRESAGGAITIARLRELPRPLARLVVIELAEQTGKRFIPQAAERLEEILELAERGGNAELHVGGSVAALIADGTLSFAVLPPRPQPRQG